MVTVLSIPRGNPEINKVDLLESPVKTECTVITIHINLVATGNKSYPADNATVHVAPNKPFLKMY